jgi:rhodanese-related sulfurtransferase
MKRILEILVFATISIFVTSCTDTAKTANAAIDFVKDYTEVDISAEDVQDLINRKADFILIDIRTPVEYNNGHLPTAVNVPIADLRRIKTRYKPRNMIVIYGISDAIQRNALSDIRSWGFESVHTLSGGFGNWTNPIVTGD